MYRLSKEVKGNNKIIAGLNLKQLIASGITLILTGIIYFITKMPFDVLLTVAAAIGAIALFLASGTVDGVTATIYLKDYIKKFMYNYDKRCYRSKNKMISEYNDYYKALKINDLKDKKKARIIKANSKRKSPASKMIGLK